MEGLRSRLALVHTACMDHIAPLRLCGEDLPDRDFREYLVGRHAKCDLHLDSKDLPFFISRQHAKVIVRAGPEVSVVDLQSLNGTFINNVMITPNTQMPLSMGDTITFGCVAPETTVVPGTAVVQDNPRFRFVLQELSDEYDASLSATIPKPVSFSTPQHAANSDQTKDERKGGDSAVVCCTPPHSHCATPLSINQSGQENQLQAEDLKPKLGDEPEPPSANTGTNLNTPKNNTLPLTVSNLIAYSGCKFQITNIDSSCGEKENLDDCNSKGTNKSKPESTRKRKVNTGRNKRTPKRRRSSNFTQKKNRKSSGPALEACSYFECRLKKGRRDRASAVVSWVQCDSCDKWFHTECVGCDYNRVKLTSQKFQCGLC